MQELASHIVDKFSGGVVVSTPAGGRHKVRTNTEFKYGQKVWVRFDFTKNEVRSIHKHKSDEAAPVKAIPVVPIPTHPDDDSHHIGQEIEEAYLSLEES